MDDVIQKDISFFFLATNDRPTTVCVVFQLTQNHNNRRKKNCIFRLFFFFRHFVYFATPSIKPTFKRIHFSVNLFACAAFCCSIACNAYISMDGRMCHSSDFFFFWNADEMIISALMLPKIVLTTRRQQKKNNSSTPTDRHRLR